MGLLGCNILKRAGFKAVKVNKSKKKDKDKDTAAALVAKEDDGEPAASAVSVDPSEETAASYQWDADEPIGGDIPASGFTGGPGASGTDFLPLGGGG